MCFLRSVSFGGKMRNIFEIHGFSAKIRLNRILAGGFVHRYIKRSLEKNSDLSEDLVAFC